MAITSLESQCLDLLPVRSLTQNMPEWKVGDLFGAELPYTDVQAVPASKAKAFRRLTGLISEDQISLGVGALGMPGSTAYGGLIDILKPQKGETLWVSGAAGAVGSMVGMMAKTCVLVVQLLAPPEVLRSANL